MPPSKRKHFPINNTSGPTLHDFFSAKLVDACCLNQPRSIKTQNTVGKEVIVIDSDSDDVLEIIEGTSPLRKRRKSGHTNLNEVEERSSGVEFSEARPNLFGRPYLLCSGLQDTPLDSDEHFTNGGLPASESLVSDLSVSTSGIDLTLANWDGDSITNDDISDKGDPHPLQESKDAAFEPPETFGHTDAFSLLMSSSKSEKIWKEADITGNKSGRTNSIHPPRKAPFYKILQGMPIAVDAFSYGSIPGVSAYFLSHAHSDHYTNLSSSWRHGPIYCSEQTANLIIHMLNVDKKWVRPLPMDIPCTIPDTKGVTVTLIEANHCPGSCLFLFEGPRSIHAGDGSPSVVPSKIFRYLHCGDFRASPQHVLHPVLRGKTIDHVYLDTTYLDPKYTFPPQPLVVSACAELAKKVVCGENVTEGTSSSSMFSWLAEGKENEKIKSLIVVGTYSIGKERIVKAIAHAVHSKIYCDSRKAGILRCQADPELDALLTSDPKDSIVHILPLAMISTDQLKIYLERLNGTYNRIIGLRPTGWTYTQSAGSDSPHSIATIITKASERSFSHLDLKLSPKSTSMIQVYPVPYSEHSSFNELTCFAMSFSWVKIIATVNVGSETSRAKMSKWFAKWEAEKKKSANNIVPYRHAQYW